MDPADDARAITPGPLDLVAFACEVGMFVLLGLAGWRLFDESFARIVATVVLPAAAVGVWAIWMAPSSSHRLANPLRLVAQVGLFFATAAIAASATLVWPAVIWAALAVAAFSALAVPSRRA